ncbi:MAG TPA: hypothetical protein VN648_33170, partial [Candidatus Methylomirabilis sp.]|nr:hypothetical protein [Candidatus Methylomirabilis sp.]
RLPKLDAARVVHLTGPGSAVATSPGGELLAAAVEARGKHQVLVCDLAQGVQIAELGAYGEDVLQLLFSRDKTTLAARYARTHLFKLGKARRQEIWRT